MKLYLSIQLHYRINDRCSLEGVVMKGLFAKLIRRIEYGVCGRRIRRLRGGYA